MFGRKKGSGKSEEPHWKDRHKHHPEREAWIQDKAAHGDDPPLLPDGTRPAPPEHHVDPEVINRDTRFAPHKNASERVE